MNKINSSVKKEWAKTVKAEQAYIEKLKKREDPKLNKLLKEKAPEKLQNTLNKAFLTAFDTLFGKGTQFIEKTFRRSELEKSYKINEYAAEIKGDRKSLRAFSKKANRAENKNMLLSGISGIGLGALGIGIPDIILFTGLMLKSIYEISLNYGFDYESEEEKMFILLLIQASLSRGSELTAIDEQVNHYIEYNDFNPKTNMDIAIANTSKCLSNELVYMKFLQGIPIIGAAAGAYDAVFLKQTAKYAELKYRRRFYFMRMYSK